MKNNKSREFHYNVQMRWSGNLGKGTSGYTTYSRAHEITSAGKPTIHGSSDPAFRGDVSCYNPEELLVSSLSACHMLWYLHLCAEAGVVVTGYEDRPLGTMVEAPSGEGQFTRVVLEPVVRIVTGSDYETAKELHTRAHEKCFISRSVNFPVECSAVIEIGDTDEI